MPTQRSLVQTANVLLVIVLVAFAAVSPASAAQNPQKPFAGSAIPQFVQPLPTLALPGSQGTMAVADGTQPFTLTMCEFDAKVLPPGTFQPGVQPATRVWGYIQGTVCPTAVQDTYIGPVILATRGVPTVVTFVNQLGTTATTQVLAYKYSSDQTLHWADPLNNEMNMCSHNGVPAPGSDCAKNYGEGIPGGARIPAAVHLHGGEVPPELDGGPDAWYTSDGLHKGHGYYSFGQHPDNGAVYKYPNTQEAAPIWFHDHTLGATRLNVYGGLAGAYLIKDPNLSLPAGLDAYGLSRNGAVDATVPLVLQDRTFDTNGQFFMPADSAGGMQWAPNPDHPYWVPEFVGDTIVVNGKAWPYFKVEPKRYRFLFLNGSNARTYEMFLTNPKTKVNGPALYVIGTDGGYLDAPVKVDPNAPKGQLQRLTMMPGERYEVIIDFSAVAPGTNLVLKNVAKTPYPAGTSPQGTTVGQIMQFQVGACTSNACGAQDTSYNPALGTALRSGAQALVRLVDPAAGQLAQGVSAAKTRQLTLNEVLKPAATALNPVTGANTAYPGGPLEILVNNTSWSGESARTYGDFTQIQVGDNTTYYSELPQEGDTEIWEIVNLTADAHPIHLHLVQFQILNRQNFNTNNYNAAYAAAFPTKAYQPGFGPPLDYRAGNNPLSGGKDGGNPDVKPYLQGPVTPPAASEAGWKDTAIMYPGQVTRIAVRWAPTDKPASTLADQLYFQFDPSGSGSHGYVWHCHIIDHEDNEMMRPDLVQLNPLAPAANARPLQRGRDY